jgi:uncharacterized membrane protein YadS
VIYGLGASLALALLATLAGRFVPLVGAPVLAIVFGVLVRSVYVPPDVFKTGL